MSEARPAETKMDAIAVGSVAVSARATSVTEANEATSILKSTID